MTATDKETELLEKWDDLTEEEILTANIKKYADDDIVKFYDEETGGADLEYLEHEIIFPLVVKHLRRQPDSVLSAIDVCGGAGKAAFILERCGGCETVLLDSAEKMLEIADRKIAREKIKTVTPVLDDALRYLKTTEKVFDVVVFSSAIHHFKDPVQLISLAFDKLSPRGVMVILGEPTRMVSSGKYKRIVSTYGFFTSSDARRGFFKSIPDRLKGRYKAPDYRDPAEYQAHLGIDDISLRSSLSDLNMNVMLHFNYPAAPSNVVRFLPYLGLNWVMGMVVTREPDHELKKQLEQALIRNLPYKINIR